MSLGRMAETLLRERGVNTSMMSEREIAMQTLNLGGKRSFAGAHGTADFPYILANVANKFLLAGYNAEPMTHLAFSYARTVRDLKQVSTVRLGSIDKLPKVLENGEYTYATIGEEREVYTISKYGQILPLSIEMIINDDLSAFTRLGEEMGRAAGRTELDLVYGSAGVFGANTSAGETMGDGVALFNAAHNNLAGAHTALDDAGLAALRKLLRDQTDINGNNINLMPSKLLVGSTLETTAEKLINGSLRSDDRRDRADRALPWLAAHCRAAHREPRQRCGALLHDERPPLDRTRQVGRLRAADHRDHRGDGERPDRLQGPLLRRGEGDRLPHGCR
jgi:hypothetical protein